MIIEMVMNVIYSVFALLTKPINIPDLPANVEGFLILLLNILVRVLVLLVTLRITII